MTVHLVTVVGGHAPVLPHMLAHYRSLGIESIFLNLHVSREDDPAREEIESIARADGCGIAAVKAGDWQDVIQEMYLLPREQYPDDWFVLADQDELQAWPGPIPEILRGFGGYDYARGCFIDRIARDGGFPAVTAAPVQEQFPLGCWLSAMVLGADPRKVVAARGRVPLKKGQHHAYAGRAVPVRECYVPVHHFKWTENTFERLCDRAEKLQTGGFPQWIESARFVEYYRACGGRINVSDPGLRVAECEPEYPHWEELKKIVVRAPVIL